MRRVEPVREEAEVLEVAPLRLGPQDPEDGVEARRDPPPWHPKSKQEGGCEEGRKQQGGGGVQSVALEGGVARGGEPRALIV